MSNTAEQLDIIRARPGFIAALDQSGGSTPKALGLYGVEASAWSNEAEMFDLVHAMRTRIVTSPAFDSTRILGAILFEDTMDREVEGLGSAAYLWQRKRIVPFLKVDKGLAEERHGTQVMKPMPELDALLERAKAKGIFGTKMRSVIKRFNADGIEAVVSQQFEIAKRILAAGLVPIVEPEMDIHCDDKPGAEVLLKVLIVKELNALTAGQVILKLTLPDFDNLYAECVGHPNVLRVAALSGGYRRAESNARLSRQNGMTASFSRALTEGLAAQQSDAAFNEALDDSIASIFEAANT
ncbi:MAG: fructose bisphosphate aldolase [Gammaproteobacteria bacterium]|nr:fructose bisphosphate aldolase [Gammaproteobacteria bacterium]